MTKIEHPQITFTMNRILKEDIDYILSKRTDGMILENFIIELIEDYVDSYFTLQEDVTTHLKSCPRCGKIVNARTMIEKEFGWRVSDGKTIPQSHCRECRRKEMADKNERTDK